MPSHHILSLPTTLTTQFGTRLTALTSQQALAYSAALKVLSWQDLGAASADACILKRLQLAPGVVRTIQHHLTQWGHMTLQTFKTG